MLTFNDCRTCLKLDISRNTGGHFVAKKLLMVLLVIFSILVISSIIMAQTTLIVEYNNEEWFAGIQNQQTERKMIGLLGYQEDYSALLLGISTHKNQITVNGSVGRQMYVGNLWYKLGAHIGNLNQTMSLGLVGDVKKQVNNKLAYGFSGELDVLKPTINGQPYLEFRDSGVLRTMLGFGSDPVYLRLDYNMQMDLLSDISGYAQINIERDYQYGLNLTFLDMIGFSGQFNSAREFAVKLSYKFEI